jgi:hypothetical protein
VTRSRRVRWRVEWRVWRSETAPLHLMEGHGSLEAARARAVELLPCAWAGEVRIVDLVAGTHRAWNRLEDGPVGRSELWDREERHALALVGFLHSMRATTGSAVAAGVLMAAEAALLVRLASELARAGPTGD